MPKIKILLVDDDIDILELLEYNLLKAGYHVLKASKGDEALDMVKKHYPDLILLDIMMPGKDGHTICVDLKENPKFYSIPVIFLTARSDEMTELRALDEGADDFITKPISISKLLLRIKAVLRRTAGPNPPGSVAENNVIRLGGLEIDRSRFLVVRNEEIIQLPKKEFEILFFLAENVGMVISRKELLDKIWGENVFVGDRTVDVHILKIRKRIGNGYIETVKGVGYRFAG